MADAATHGHDHDERGFLPAGLCLQTTKTSGFFISLQVGLLA